MYMSQSSRFFFRFSSQSIDLTEAEMIKWPIFNHWFVSICANLSQRMGTGKTGILFKTREWTGQNKPWIWSRKLRMLQGNEEGEFYDMRWQLQASLFTASSWLQWPNTSLDVRLPCRRRERHRSPASQREPDGFLSVRLSRPWPAVNRRRIHSALWIPN